MSFVICSSGLSAPLLPCPCSLPPPPLTQRTQIPHRLILHAVHQNIQQAIRLRQHIYHTQVGGEVGIVGREEGEDVVRFLEEIPIKLVGNIGEEVWGERGVNAPFDQILKTMVP